jgi:hypothetical protein
MKRVWMVAAAPLLLMAAMFFSFWVLPSWAEIISPEACLLVLAGAVLTGLSVLLFIFVCWLHGANQFKRGEVLAATMLASLDVLIPAALAVLVWLILREWGKNGGILMF